MHSFSQNNKEQPPVSHGGDAPQHEHVWVSLCYEDSDRAVYPLPPPYLAPIIADYFCPTEWQDVRGNFVIDDEVSKYLDNKLSVRVYCKEEIYYSLSIHGGEVVLAPSYPFIGYQHWKKDEKFGKNVFALVNNETGEALKHPIGANHPVRLTDYNPDILDESVLWTNGSSSSDGRCMTIRPAGNVPFEKCGFMCVKKLDRY